MALTLATYLAGLQTPSERVPTMKASMTVVAGQRELAWTIAPFGAGAYGPASAATTRTTAGALGQQNAAASTNRFVIGWNAVCANTATATSILLIDRLNQSSGLSGTVTTAQTTGLPTAALTRYTTGDGVWAALDITSTIVGTNTIIQCSYTNQAGTAGRISGEITSGGAPDGPAQAFRIMPFAAGDSGVRSVENVDLTVSTTVAGDFGVCLFKPLMHLPVPVYSPENMDTLIDLAAQFSEIIDDACLTYAVMSTGTSTQGHSAELMFLDI